MGFKGDGSRPGSRGNPRYSDLVVPIGGSGSPFIRFELKEGQLLPIACGTEILSGAGIRR
ncbi:MAG: hypothetical protein A2405_00915 [Candidatus Yanofskybacteria bacterium RIFOXYC1_FULL_44_16]|nr:MAG: hypothetical protein A2241_00945 [Candidatus Yanofskybacteria bacterium RIFOXYA2_FULL_45_28]OGN38040.1 MAG: hypothetical protein A2405_00915 [Candidatus Yanofskybacteria bacterium RIFOXYC1_FULL_44_16]